MHGGRHRRPSVQTGPARGLPPPNGEHTLALRVGRLLPDAVAPPRERDAPGRHPRRARALRAAARRAPAGRAGDPRRGADQVRAARRRRALVCPRRRRARRVARARGRRARADGGARVLAHDAGDVPPDVELHHAPRHVDLARCRCSIRDQIRSARPRPLPRTA